MDDIDDYIILPHFYDIRNSFILTEFPFCENNEIKVKTFSKEVSSFD